MNGKTCLKSLFAFLTVFTDSVLGRCIVPTLTDGNVKIYSQSPANVDSGWVPQGTVIQFICEDGYTIKTGPVVFVCGMNGWDYEVTPVCTVLRDVCVQCKDTAEKVDMPRFVGHACRVDRANCYGLIDNRYNMYPANDWFFLHCSPDGPWCKPCAMRSLVYNPKCQQCESTRNGSCTGPIGWS